MCARVRPLSEVERRRGDYRCVSTVGRQRVVVHDGRVSGGSGGVSVSGRPRTYVVHREFDLDLAFPASATDEQVYRTVGLPLALKSHRTARDSSCSPNGSRKLSRGGDASKRLAAHSLAIASLLALLPPSM